MPKEVKPEDMTSSKVDTKVKDLGCSYCRTLFKIGNHVITKSSALTNDRKLGTIVGYTKTKVKVKFDHIPKTQSVDPDKIQIDLTFHIYD